MSDVIVTQLQDINTKVFNHYHIHYLMGYNHWSKVFLHIMPLRVYTIHMQMLRWYKGFFFGNRKRQLKISHFGSIFWKSIKCFSIESLIGVPGHGIEQELNSPLSRMEQEWRTCVSVMWRPTSDAVWFHQQIDKHIWRTYSKVTICDPPKMWGRYQVMVSCCQQ